MKIYADMLFAINFSMDFISLFLTAVLSRKKPHKKRILISAALGGAYGVFEVLVNLNAVISVIVSVAVSFLMCFIAYYEKSVKRFVLMYAIYWGISACLGGFMSVLYSFLNKLLYNYISEYSYTQAYTGARFFIIMALAIIASIIFTRAYTREKDIKSAQIRIIFNEKEYKMNALCDSGNLLTEPLSGKSVILVTEQSVIGREISKTEDIYKRYIPYTSAGTSGVVKGIAPKHIEINGEQRDALVATIKQTDFAGYEACVPSALV